MMQSLILRKQATRFTSQYIRCYSEYKPWSNEYSVSGTTWETVERKVATDKTVDPDKELNETKEEARSNGGQDVLEWSAANKRISDIPAGTENLWTSADTLAMDKTPSSCHYQPPKPGPLHEGLYKPLKRPVYKRYSE